MKSLRRHLRMSAAIIAVGALPASAIADDFFVTFPVFVTNGGNVIDGFDTLTITVTGSITTAAVNAFAVYAQGSNNAIANLGQIATGGDGATGIVGFDANSIVNSGSITTLGNFAFGAYLRDNNIIINTGSISTSGNSAEGIEAVDGNTITNSGSIMTLGNDAHGAFVRDNNIISNTGSISTSGSDARGIWARSGNTIANSGSIVTLGYDAHGILFNENNIVSNTGSISTFGDLAIGIYGNDNNTITNSGTIATAGVFALGIFANDDNTVTNSGWIATTGRFGTGIYTDDDNTITNSGWIETTGDDSSGIVASDDNTIANSGWIETTGDISSGIVASDYNTTTNSGWIKTTGDRSDGIYASTYNVITNSGSITTQGMYSYGIFACCGNIIVNTGTIDTFGPRGVGIGAGNNNVITNSGRVVSAQDESFQLGNNNTLNLFAPSFIGGVIDLGNNTLVNVVTGPPHDILWDFSTGTMNGGAPNITGTVPFFYNPATMKLATFNTVFFNGAGNALADVSGNLSSLMQGRLGGSAGGLNSNINAFAATKEAEPERRIAQAFGEGEASSSYAPAGGFWIAAFGSQADYENGGVGNDYRVRNSGYAVGYDRDASPDLTAGLLAGWGKSEFKPYSLYGGSREDAEGWFAAVYARKHVGGVFFDAAVSGGALDHSMRRFVNNNLAPLGVSFANSSYDSWWWSPEAGIGVGLPGSGGWTYVPSAHVRFAAQSIGGYAESGSAANAVVGSRDVSVWEGRIEIAAKRAMEFGPFTARLGMLSRSVSGSGAVTVALNNSSALLAISGDDVTAGYTGVDASVRLVGNVRLDLDGEFVFGGDTQGARGTARLVAEF